MNITEELLLASAQAGEARTREAINLRLAELMDDWRSAFGTDLDTDAVVPNFSRDRLSDAFTLINVIEACLDASRVVGEGVTPDLIEFAFSDADRGELRAALRDTECNDQTFERKVRSLIPMRSNDG